MIAYFMTGVTVVTFLVIGSSIAAAQEGIGRYQLMENAPLTVLDTATGQLWIASSHKRARYAMSRICYRGPKGQLMPTPYEDKFIDDLTVFESVCARDR